MVPPVLVEVLKHCCRQLYAEQPFYFGLSGMPQSNFIAANKDLQIEFHFFLFISNFSHRMSCAFCYYGLVLMSTELFGAGPNINNINTGDGNACRPLATTDYMDLLWTTLAEFPGIFATIFIIEKCGRKKTMAFQFLLYAGCVTMLTATSK